MFFGERLKQRREEKGLTQEELASFLGDNLSRQSVSKWERDESYPQVEKLLKLSVKLDISLDELFFDELNYYRKGTEKRKIDDKYPGFVSGLKTLARILHQIN
ncbi:MAG TPA: helix-turn-helix transcriptional regulator [Tepidanaerobacter syntrophicus]|uniref:helix-turn-helix domain-containing protein n=1 Tax=Tepidanaerobacter syntrophicus TaxID=224999 RepID=UPI00176366BD|nr:helix-turn-helix transcriptional regulator [Tepidanaerobacter syntrophicus]HHV82797.1 helix-turn-helix transcriptional regulator [Tepidanaerobacter syntrophicus]